MLCAAKMLYAACSTKHHPLKSMGDNRRFWPFWLNSFQSAEEGWFFTNYIGGSDHCFLYIWTPKIVCKKSTPSSHRFSDYFCLLFGRGWGLLKVRDPMPWALRKCVIYCCCILTATHKKKGRYHKVYKEFACGMGLGNFTAKYHIKLSLFGLKLMLIPIINFLWVNEIFQSMISFQIC